MPSLVILIATPTALEAISFTRMAVLIQKEQRSQTQDPFGPVLDHLGWWPDPSSRATLVTEILSFKMDRLLASC